MGGTKDWLETIDFTKAPCPRDGHKLALFKKKMRQLIKGGHLKN